MNEEVVTVPRECGTNARQKGVKSIDLSKSVKHDHPEISTAKLYLVKIAGEWFFGKFSRQWYGLNFSNWGNTGCQFEAPGENASMWECVLEIDPDVLSGDAAISLDDRLSTDGEKLQPGENGAASLPKNGKTSTVSEESTPEMQQQKNAVGISGDGHRMTGKTRYRTSGFLKRKLVLQVEERLRFVKDFGSGYYDEHIVTRWRDATLDDLFALRYVQTVLPPNAAGQLQ